MQQTPNNDFDQFVKGKLENASVEAPAFLWNKIEEKLPPVTPWYSKYKYLLLLLCLVLTSASSIFIYKNIILSTKKSSDIAWNKRFLKDENQSAGKSTLKEDSKYVTADTQNNLQKISSIQSGNNKENNKNSGASVAGFYNDSATSGSTKINQPSNKTASDFAKREERLRRYEVRNENVNDALKTQITKSNSLSETSSKINTIVSVSAVSSKTKIVKKKKHKSGYGSDIPTVDDDLVAINNSGNSNNPTFNSAKNNTSALQVENSAKQPATTLGTYINIDVTKPIAEPIMNANSVPLLASAVPVKTYVSPLSSREALRAMIEKDKLESFDITSQAAGVTDLNPNREKMLKNLKQFAGYSINRGFHIGAFIGINNVWLNKKEFSSDENISSIKPKVQFGKAYGLNIGYDYSDRWGIELEWQISEQGQKYNIGLLADNNKHTKDINLMYTKFPILIKYKQTFINNYNSKPIAVSLLVGPQMSFLIKQNVSLDGVKILNAPQYNKAEYGLLGGFDFDLYMMRYMYLTIGARTGFASSFKKGQPMSFQLGLTTQLNFRYAKKLK